MNELVGVTKKLLSVAAVLALSACGTHYMTPSAPADLSKLSESISGIRDAFTAKPEAQFLANLAIVRIQTPQYDSFNARGNGDGIKRFQSMPKIATLNKLLIGSYCRRVEPKSDDRLS